MSPIRNRDTIHPFPDQYKVEVKESVDWQKHGHKPFEVAVITPLKEHRKKLLIEMMQEDEKNGMYDEPDIPHPHHNAPVVATYVRVEEESQEEQIQDLKILLDDAKTRIADLEAKLEEYRRYVRW